MKNLATLAITLLAAAQYTAAHGYVKTVTIAGQAFQANYPFTDVVNPSGIRKVSDVVPIKGAMNPDVECGISAQPATLVLSANPGDVLTFDWRGADDSYWPHDTGPFLTYMASCGTTTSDQFNMTNARWFKIDEVGLKPGNQQEWYQQDLMTGGVANATIPSNIAPGQYLLSHQIIALHLANNEGGAEFYSSCTQLNVGGTGSGVPDPNELVSIPGAYSDDDPGIWVPGIFDPGLNYIFPGPPVSHLAANSSGNVPTTTASTASTGKPTAIPKPNSKIGSCRLQSTKSSNRRRHFSRHFSRFRDFITGSIGH